MLCATDVPVDGRRARRERSRAAVIDSLFALVQDGAVPPTVEQVAALSGVSVSSIFRMFDGLDDMRAQAFEQFERRYAHLLATRFNEADDRAQRIDGLVAMRVELYVTAGSLLSMARHRALDHVSIAERVQDNRVRLAEQVRSCFSAETQQLTPIEAANLVAAIDSTTSPEAFEVLGAVHARTARQVERSWRRAVGALVDAWCDERNGEPTDDRPTERPTEQAPTEQAPTRRTPGAQSPRAGAST